MKKVNTTPCSWSCTKVFTLRPRMPLKRAALLDDYAQFVESSTDHVVNSVLKKTLWRDQDYRKRRELHRARTDGTSRPRPERTEKQ